MNERMTKGHAQKKTNNRPLNRRPLGNRSHGQKNNQAAFCFFLWNLKFCCIWYPV